MVSPTVTGNTVKNAKQHGFTLIELIVVMAIVAMLVSIAAPRYFNHVDRAKEAALATSLNVMREAIDKFHGDQGRYPETLDELVTKRYLRKVPPDPITDSTLTWLIEPLAGDAAAPTAYDVHSGAPGQGSNGKPYAEW